MYTGISSGQSARKRVGLWENFTFYVGPLADKAFAVGYISQRCVSQAIDRKIMFLIGTVRHPMQQRLVFLIELRLVADRQTDGQIHDHTAWRR